MQSLKPSGLLDACSNRFVHVADARRGARTNVLLPISWRFSPKGATDVRRTPAPGKCLKKAVFDIKPVVRPMKTGVISY
jgi:hypothetical protein